ncbi:hypothetical protein MY11210_009477 [Beauveria gryllotalpidicola]
MRQSKPAAAQAVSPRLTELSLDSTQCEEMRKAGGIATNFSAPAQNMAPTPLGEFTHMLKNDHERRVDMSPLPCQRPWLEAGPEEAQYQGVEGLHKVIVSVHLILKHKVMLDMGAFSDAGSRGMASQSLPEEKQPEKDAVPTWLPGRHQRIDSAKVLAQYVATSDYIVSLAGPPLPDMRYGVIIVPCGEEELLLKQSDQEVSYEDVKTAFSFTHEYNGLLHEESPDSLLGVQSSMASTEFRYYDRQRLLEEWEDDQRVAPWVRPNYGSDWSKTKNDYQDIWREETPKLVDPAHCSQWSAAHAPDYGSWVEQEIQSYDEDGCQHQLPRHMLTLSGLRTYQLTRHASSHYVSKGD